MAQYEWPPKTLQNADASPLLRAAAYVRGFADIVGYLLRQCMWIAEFLEQLDSWLCAKLGPDWWHASPVEQYTPRPKRGKKT